MARVSVKKIFEEATNEAQKFNFHGLNPLTGDCSGNTLNLVEGYRRWEGGDIIIPSQTYTGSLSTAGFYDYSEAVNAGAGYRYFYVDPNVPTRIYVSDNPPNNKNTRTISGTLVIYLVALRMDTNSAYTAQKFEKNTVYFMGTQTLYLGGQRGLVIRNVTATTNDDYGVNPIATNLLPHESIIESSTFYHFGTYQNASGGGPFNGDYEQGFKISGAFKYYDNESIRSAESRGAYAQLLTRVKYYTQFESMDTHNQTLNWYRNVSNPSTFTLDGNHRHVAVYSQFTDKKMMY